MLMHNVYILDNSIKVHKYVRYHIFKILKPKEIVSHYMYYKENRKRMRPPDKDFLTG